MKQTGEIFTLINQWSQQIAGTAQTGLAFCRDPYDIERYQELIRLAAEMTASINPAVEPDKAAAEELRKLWLEQIEKGFKGYQTPGVTVGGIVFNEKDELLLVFSSIHKEWCFPVGMVDIGYAPSEVVRKEVLEEAGLEVTPLQLMGVADSFQRGFNPTRHLYSLLFYCRLDGGKLCPQTKEISAAGFFGRDELPERLNMDGNPWVKDAFNWHFDRNRTPYFD